MSGSLSVDVDRVDASVPLAGGQGTEVAWPSLTKLDMLAGMLVNIGQAKTDLSKLLARVEAGEAVEIARDGVPVARLTRIERASAGSRFLAARGSLAGRIVISDDVEFTDDELDELLDEPT
jgi:prevent-host-death family protein